MKHYKFTLSFMKPQVWVYCIIVDAETLEKAYRIAFYEFAEHMRRWDLVPERLEISYVEL